MCRSEWEMEKRKSKGSGWCLTFGLSSHLFFLLSFLWVLSSSFLTLLQPHMSAKCSVSSWRHLFAVQNHRAATEHGHSWTFSCSKIIYWNYCPCHQNNLYMEMNCHLGQCSINKNPHRETGLIKGTMSCTKCVVSSCLGQKHQSSSSNFCIYIHVTDVLFILSRLFES